MNAEEKYTELGLSKYYKENPDDRAFTYNDLIEFGNICARDCEYQPHLDDSILTHTRAADVQVNAVKFESTYRYPELVKIKKPAYNRTKQKSIIPSKGKCLCGGTGYVVDKQGSIVGACRCQKF